MYKYSPSTHGFYHDDIHNEIPDDCVIISDEKHKTLLDGQGKGKEITPDANGNPVLTDPSPTEPIPEQTPEEKLAALGLTIDDLKSLLK